MFKNSCIILFFAATAASCYNPPRNCSDFKEGTFSYTSLIDGKEERTTFVREDGIEIDYFKGKADTSSVRWINDCEYVVRKLYPANRAEEKSIHMKILSTTDTSYTFEYGEVGKAIKIKGTAFKID